MNVRKLERTPPFALYLLLLSGWTSGCDPDAASEDAGLEIPDADRPASTVIDGGWLDDVRLPDPLPPLPPHGFVAGEMPTHDVCSNCHRAADGSPAMRDEAGNAIGPDELWSASIMGMSGRDPYWLAVFSHELEENPEAATTVEHLCTRCHAPAAAVSRTPQRPITFADIVSGDTSDAHLARDGVNCALCHRLDDVDLGANASFTGGYAISELPQAFGPHREPDGAGMMAATGYQPLFAEHALSSALCATCHTVITQALDATGAIVGPDFPEQVPYLEWRNSAFNDEVAAPALEARSCGECHVPTVSDRGTALSTPMATAPPGLPPRQPYGRHTFFGGNAYMLQVLAENLAWTGSDVAEAPLLAASEQTAAFLETSADVTVDVTVEDGVLDARVHIVNRTGHRLPTAYPSRRIILRFSVLDASGSVLWRSGRLHSRGGLTDRAGRRLDLPGAYSPHFGLITREDQVQVYEAVMADLAGGPTRSLLRAATFLKDNRILPLGWEPDHPDAPMTRAFGVEGDADYRPGEDTVAYRLQVPEGAAQVVAELLYQAVPAPAVEYLFDLPTPATARFEAMRRARPDRGRVITRASAPLPTRD